MIELSTDENEIKTITVKVTEKKNSHYSNKKVYQKLQKGESRFFS